MSFENNDNKFYDAKYIITILENEMGETIENLKNKVNNNKVNVTEDEITEYLDKKFQEENPELKARIENSQNKNIGVIEFGITDDEITQWGQNFTDRLKAKRYYFEPYTLEYFKRYSNIVRNKALILLDIIEKIGNKNTNSIQDLIIDLDINIDKEGNILKDDINRLIIPTIYNINVLTEKVTQANNLDTYLTFKMSLDSLYRNDCSEEELYPSKSIQIKNLYYDHVKGNVRLSNNQKAELETQQRRSMKKNAKILLDL